MTLRKVTFIFNKMQTAVAEVMIRFFRDQNLNYRNDCNVKSIRFEYEDREREAILSLMSGVLNDN
jgi:hypothetical protein